MLSLRSVIACCALLLGSVLLRAQSHAALADSLRRAGGVPELAYAVVTADSVLEIAYLGHHAIDLPDTAMATDRFHLGSNTKAMTAFIAGKLVETGKIKWTTRFFDLYPTWKTKANPVYYAITLQDLLSHRARIQPFTDDAEGKDMPALKGTHQQMRLSLGQYVLGLPPVPVDTAAHYTYSNAGYTLASLMLEKVSGKTWEALVTQTFDQDLKIAAGFSWPNNQLRKETWGHIEENGKLQPVPSNTTYRLDGMEPAGDLNMTLPDYIRFIQLNISGLAGKNNYLKATTYRFLHEGLPDYAMGWANVYEGNRGYSSHSGSAGTYFCVVTIDRQKQTAYIVFMNCATNEATQALRLLMRRLKAAYDH
jgi:CubicO group peptidase (beta-lactamase class C family)